MNKKMVIVCGFCCGLLTLDCAQGGVLSFDFNVDGVLPSAEGAYFDSHGPGQAETDMYSVAGGLLHQNSLGAGAAFYGVVNAYNPAFDVALEWRAKVDLVSHASVSVYLLSGTHSFSFFLRNDGVYFGPIDGSSKIASVDTSDFHTYRLELEAGSSVMDFFVDGVFQSSGSGLVASWPHTEIQWGDWSGFTDAGIADWDYVRIINGGPAVPEPASALLLGMGVACGGVLRWRRRVKAARSGAAQL